MPDKSLYLGAGVPLIWMDELEAVDSADSYNEFISQFGCNCEECRRIKALIDMFWLEIRLERMQKVMQRIIWFEHFELSKR